MSGVAEAAGAEELDVLLSWPEPEIALVTLNQPGRLNALSRPMVTRFLAALHDAGQAEGCRVIIVTGAGRGFCAGMDIVGAVSRHSGVADSLPSRMNGQELFSSMPRAIRTLRQPVIMAVNGAAAGAGLGIVLAGDIRVASASASFHIAAVKIGLSAGECGISYHLPRLIGMSKAYEYMLTARPIRSADALEMGLVSRVVPDGEVVDAALEIAREIAVHSPFAIWQTKQVMRQNVDHDFESAIAVENRAQILALSTEDSKEAMTAFVEKRSAVYTGR